MSVKVMLKLPSLPITISIAVIWSLFYFPSPGNTQDDPVCYIVTPSGQVKNLERICQQGQEMVAKANACQGPFDQEGFPVVFSQEVSQLKEAIANARHRSVNVAGDAQVQSAVAALRNQMPFGTQWEQIQEQRQAIFRQMRGTLDSGERARLRDQLRTNLSQLSTDQCYRKFTQALTTQLRPLIVPRQPATFSPGMEPLPMRINGAR